MFLFHIYHFHHEIFDAYCFESDIHRAIRHGRDKIVKMKEIEEELYKLGYYDNMEEQQVYIKEDIRSKSMIALFRY